MEADDELVVAAVELVDLSDFFEPSAYQPSAAITPTTATTITISITPKPLRLFMMTARLILASSITAFKHKYNGSDKRGG